MNSSYLTLRKRADFERVFREGERIWAGGLSIIRCPGPERQPRVGFVASRRLGGAVVRNRAKRRLREAARRVTWARGRDYIVIASPGVESVGFAELVQWLEAAA